MAGVILNSSMISLFILSSLFLPTALKPDLFQELFSKCPPQINTNFYI